jgi:hypothetical protein
VSRTRCMAARMVGQCSGNLTRLKADRFQVSASTTNALVENRGARAGPYFWTNV